MYMAHMYIRGSLSRLAPRLVAKPALQEVWESPIAYTVIVAQLKRDGDMLLAGLGLGLGLGLAAVGAAAWAWAASSRK